MRVFFSTFNHQLMELFRILKKIIDSKCEKNQTVVSQHGMILKKSYYNISKSKDSFISQYTSVVSIPCVYQSKLVLLYFSPLKYSFHVSMLLVKKRGSLLFYD